MKRNMVKWVDEMREAKEKKGFLILSFPAIQKMGITVKELVNSSDLQAKAMKIVADSTPEAAAAVGMMDLSLEAEAFGSEVRFADDEVPAVIGSIVNSKEEADALKVPEVGAGRTGIYIDAMEKAVQLIEDRPVLAGVIGPFSLAGRLMDVSETMIYCYMEPEMVHIVLEKATDFLIQYINAYKAVGANGVMIAEPLAGLLSPTLEEEFSTPYIKKIVEATQTDDFIVAYHNCGNCTIQQIDSIVQNGCPVLHFGNAIDIAEMMEHIPSDMVAMGNIDPAGQFTQGTPESVKAATMELMTKCASYPNFVVSSGCDIPPMASWDNIDAFFEGIREFYRK